MGVPGIGRVSVGNFGGPTQIEALVMVGGPSIGHAGSGMGPRHWADGRRRHWTHWIGHRPGRRLRAQATQALASAKWGGSSIGHTGSGSGIGQVSGKPSIGHKQGSGSGIGQIGGAPKTDLALVKTRYGPSTSLPCQPSSSRSLAMPAVLAR